MIENAIVKKKYQANLICLIVGALLIVVCVALAIFKGHVDKKDKEAALAGA